MSNSDALLTCNQKSSVKLHCEINLHKLFVSPIEKERFNTKWEGFLASDPGNKKIFKLRKHKLFYESEHLIPEKKDKRPPLLLVLGNPASHSVHAGIFFAFKGDGKENRFWNNILKPAGILSLPDIGKKPASELNRLRRTQLKDLDYDGPYRIGLCVFISMPSAPGGKWGGVAGVQRLIGVRALRRLEAAEVKRIQACVKDFIGTKGKVVVFQKNAWNALKSNDDPAYSVSEPPPGLYRERRPDGY